MAMSAVWTGSTYGGRPAVNEASRIAGSVGRWTSRAGVPGLRRRLWPGTRPAGLGGHYAPCGRGLPTELFTHDPDAGRASGPPVGAGIRSRPVRSRRARFPARALRRQGVAEILHLVDRADLDLAQSRHGVWDSAGPSRQPRPCPRLAQPKAGHQFAGRRERGRDAGSAVARRGYAACRARNGFSPSREQDALFGQTSRYTCPWPLAARRTHLPASMSADSAFTKPLHAHRSDSPFRIGCGAYQARRPEDPPQVAAIWSYSCRSRRRAAQRSHMARDEGALQDRLEMCAAPGSTAV